MHNKKVKLSYLKCYWKNSRYRPKTAKSNYKTQIVHSSQTREFLGKFSEVLLFLRNFSPPKKFLMENSLFMLFVLYFSTWIIAVNVKIEENVGIPSFSMARESWKAFSSLLIARCAQTKTKPFFSPLTASCCAGFLYAALLLSP